MHGVSDSDQEGFRCKRELEDIESCNEFAAGEVELPVYKGDRVYFE